MSTSSRNDTAPPHLQEDQTMGAVREVPSPAKPRRMVWHLVRSGLHCGCMNSKSRAVEPQRRRHLRCPLRMSSNIAWCVGTGRRGATMVP
ncbi:hypothetical protein V5799_022408 [Amblyomma americanum]|uniref:Uncharacterized protein n=1 Tax=Amblyomma americanum TaxID=6943 RepID=A0AAQ4FKL3_AMBAM